MHKDAVIFVAGGDKLLDAALFRRLTAQGFANLVGHHEEAPDLTDRASVEDFFARHRPEYVFLTGGKSGGIRANQKYPADFILDNLLVITHLLDAAHRHRVRKLFYLASSCCYPRHCPQPMRVEHLMTGRLEPTSEAYAAAKLAGLVMCQAYRQQHGSPFIVAIPANSFGPGDSLHVEDAHVVTALVQRMHDAKIQGQESVEIWGTGAPRREFLFADDLADGCLFLMSRYDDSAPINLGGGQDISIHDLALLTQEVVGYQGRLDFNPAHPDGMPFKALDSSEIAKLGWRPRTSLRAALALTYAWFLELSANNLQKLSTPLPAGERGRG